MEQDLRRQIIAYGRRGYERGLAVGTGGNISCRCPGGLLITRSGSCLGSLETEDILLVDEAGRCSPARTGFRPSIETGFHQAVYRSRPEVGCVYHIHATYCTYWALREQELPLVTSVARMLLGPVPLVAYAEPGSPELAELIARALSQRPAALGLLLAGHGAVALGPTAEQAFYTVELLEQTAQLAYMLEAKGFPRL